MDRDFTAAEVDAQLLRILASGPFERSPRLSRFLRYLVEQKIAGNHDGVKEYQLGVDVFDRGPDFDPRIDTMVRVQARNLRGRLQEYYDAEGAHDPIHIEMVRGGYSVAFTRVASVAAAPQHRSRAMYIGLAACVALAGVAALWYFWPRPAPVADAKVPNVAIMVAPFVNLSANKEDEYFTIGLTDELINSLTKVKRLDIIARSSSIPFNGDAQDLEQIHKKLNVQVILEGSVRKEGRKVRIAVRLLDANNGKHLWSSVYERQIDDVLVTQQEIANAIAATLQLQFAAAPAAPYVTNPAAYDLYLKGRYYWSQSNATQTGDCIKYAEQSIALDPKFAPAYSVLAGCYGLATAFNIIPAVEGWGKIRAMANKAIELDETLSEAHTLLGGAYAWFDWNYPRSELEYRRAIQLAPGSVIGHQYFASFLGALGRGKEAEEEMKQARRLDPLSVLARWGDAQLMFWRGDDKGAEKLLLTLTEQDPHFPLTYPLLAEVYCTRGDFPNALAMDRKLLEFSPKDASGRGSLGYVLAKMNEKDKAREVLAELERESAQGAVPQQALAQIHLGLGEYDEAIRLLSVACDRRTLRPPWLTAYPSYRLLRSRPAFRELLKHVNLSIQ